jgi:hypothetical protein
VYTVLSCDCRVFKQNAKAKFDTNSSITAFLEMNFSRGLSTFKGKGVEYAPMGWQKKMEFMKATMLCFTPVVAWAVYQETELHKIKLVSYSTVSDSSSQVQHLYHSVLCLLSCLAFWV